MPKLHGWAECEPVALNFTTMEIDRVTTAKLLKVWETLTDGEKIMFHQYTCHNRHSEQHLAVADMIARRMA